MSSKQSKTVNRRRSKRACNLYDDPSENLREAENNRMYDAFTREDVALHRKINSYAIDNSDPPEVKRRVLENFVCMPKKIITRSMHSFIYSNQDSGFSTKSSSDVRSSPTPTVLTPTVIQNPESEPMDPRSRGETMDVKLDFSVQESRNTSSIEVRPTSSCSIDSPVSSYDHYSEPAPIDPRSSGEALMLRSMAQNTQNPDAWSMSSIADVLKGFEVSSSISTKSRSCQTFGRSTFTMTGNNNLYRLHRSKFAETPQAAIAKPPQAAIAKPPQVAIAKPPQVAIAKPPQAAFAKPPQLFLKTEPPPAFRSPTTESLPSFLQSVQPSNVIKPPCNNLDTMDSVTSLLSVSFTKLSPEIQNETKFSKNKQFDGAKPDERLLFHSMTSSSPPPDQVSTQSDNAGLIIAGWNLITGCFKYLYDSIRTMWSV